MSRDRVNRVIVFAFLVAAGAIVGVFVSTWIAGLWWDS